METSLKKLVPLLGVFLLGVSSLAASDQTMKPVSVPPGTNPSDNGPDMFISADYTLWTARQDGLSVALANYYTAPTTTPSQASVYYPEWKLRSGFKVGIGAFLNHDQWDIQAEYTWFYNKSNSYHTANFSAGEGLTTWFPHPLTGTEVLNSASSKWNNWFNRIDLQLGRSYFAGHYLALRPFIGLLGAWDSQWLNINYQIASTPSVTNELRNKQQFWGIGPYSGFEASFCFPVIDQNNQWSLFMDTGFALPWSKFKAKHKSEADPAETFNLDYENHCWNVVPMIELALGLRWETWWSDNKWMFLLQAAWEEQVWFDHNHFLVAGGQSTFAGGNYTMQGLTIKAKVAF